MMVLVGRLRYLLRQFRHIVGLWAWRSRTPRYVSALHRHFTEHHQATQVMSELDALRLYNLVRRQKPKRCLEFGCGIGTSATIIAAAMRDNGEGDVMTLEQLDWMADVARDLIPEDYRPLITIVTSESEVREYFGQSWICYKFRNFPPDVDLVIVDGPNGWTDVHGEKVNGPNGDLVAAMPSLARDCLVYIDGRKETFDAIRASYEDEFRVSRIWRGRPLLIKR